MKNIRTKWAECFADKDYRLKFLLTAPLDIALISFLPFFFTFLENRGGVTLHDPFLTLFAARDISGFTFAVTYLAGLTGIIYILGRPRIMLRVMQAYVIMMSMRLVCLYLLPLNAPATIIPLEDVFLSTFFYSGQAYKNDLFFSGHTATILLFALAAAERPWALYFLVSAILIGSGVVIQHVHYTIDVLAAPVFVWAAWTLSRLTAAKA